MDSNDTKNQADPNGRLIDRNWRDSHSGLDAVTVERLDRLDMTAKELARIEELRRSHGEKWAKIVAGVYDSETRAILFAAVSERQPTYDEVAEYASCSRRTIDRRVRDLESSDILDRTNTRPARIGFATEAMAILAEDALSVFFND